MSKKNIICLILLVSFIRLFSQGMVESVLTYNGTLVQKYNELKQKSQDRSGGSITDTLSLGTEGFLDDFSYEGPYPDTAKWLDNYVFVNRNLSIAPITIGAATFDGVNANGYPYDFTAGAGTSGKADTLTSKPIDLYLPGDTTVYFSFYYQAGGRGDYPFTKDSLVLEFKDPSVMSSPWKHVWSTKGLSSQPTDSSWKYVSIHINNPIFLKRGFQFRFSNYATLSGTFDNWHLDYIYLNKNRYAGDSLNTIKDVTFIYNTPSLLTTYTAMPWRHYTPAFMRARTLGVLRNNNDADDFGKYGYKIYDENNAIVSNYLSGALTYSASSIIKVSPSVDSLFIIPALTGRTRYRMESYLIGSPDRILKNDTVSHTQEFHNYFSYDDGTAETSYGLAGYLHAQIAEKFTLSVSDTLRCIDIYFNPQLTNDNQYTFNLKVWSVAGSGAPGLVIFTSIDSLYKPLYNQTGHNHFTRYYLEKPVYLTAGTSFFIGFDQNTVYPINIGWDKNNNTQYSIYYNTSGSWSHPADKGSLMMHPVFGSASEVVGIETPLDIVNNKILVYPNPANDKLYIHFENEMEFKTISFEIVDIYGRIISRKSVKNSEGIDLSSVSNGVYFIRISTTNQVSTHKFIISR
jgi:hypothetical protein